MLFSLKLYTDNGHIIPRMQRAFLVVDYFHQFFAHGLNITITQVAAFLPKTQGLVGAVALEGMFHPVAVEY